MRDPEVFKVHFEQQNKHLGLYYTRQVMNQLFELLEDIQSRIGYDEDYLTPWTTKMEYFEALLPLVKNPYSRRDLKDRYVALLSLAKRVPVDRAQSYAVFRKQLLDLSEQAIDFEAKGREELQMIENYGFIVPHENITEEEIKKIEDDKKAKKAEWIKKTKKKAKTEDEENNDLEELRNRVSNNLKNDFLAHRVERA